MELRCSTNFGTRKCNKYLGTFLLLIGKYYCKSCGKSNYYEIVTPEGITKARKI